MVEAPAPATTSSTTSFPVVLYDGIRETLVGNVQIHPDLVFKSFQTKLTEITGISYNNLTTYLVDSSKSKTSPDRRKILITGKVNFAVVVRETNCYFFAVLKRSRRDRRRKAVKPSDLHVSTVSPDDLSRISLNRNNLNVKPSDLDVSSDDLSRISLNRNGLNVKPSDLDVSSVDLSRFSLNHNGFNRSYCYDDRFHDLLMNRVNRGKYMNVILNSGYEFDSDSRLDTNFPTIEDAYPRVYDEQRNVNRSLCEDCTVAKKQRKSPEFHHCVYDEVVVGVFRSPAGPVCRPLDRSVQ
ncbi:hypothetical protein HanXRQr2_Chr11g0511421 [Helianthus annuus]|uniref:DUF7138 domain-containing protein n=1 Tax=Helianthus annuus TaxID=4232 RepID=A0A9K3HS29_HELAN|nr:hypothetical protein HanXRQr2_Chr11g0511421 [Helianthus annuus]KAJ0503021.1 hypothetical protein HanHA300_Chr11g0419531 [Helianthus annuus]KAJ0511251.1 hypothetical protein HanIR_Chr11g0549861 [Helianthus annuus]KAJ0518985.1 hypothetical protein HanHA89_Chr11g0443561 [Helianthus annuus]KAJ0686983.1 hypothetical protein HanLR1_Chr11g0420831 [Helianthus annuus]